MAFISGVPAGGEGVAPQGELWLSVSAKAEAVAAAKTNTTLSTLYLSFRNKLPMHRGRIALYANYRPTMLPRPAACDKRRQTGNDSRFPPTDGGAGLPK